MLDFVPLRFVGGPLHGQLRQVSRNSYNYVVPIQNVVRVAWAEAPEIPPDVHPYDEVVYTRRMLGLGSWARVELWAPEKMTEPEFMRRVADILEGVGERARR